jgi:hypothetical protein
MELSRQVFMFIQTFYSYCYYRRRSWVYKLRIRHPWLSRLCGNCSCWFLHRESFQSFQRQTNPLSWIHRHDRISLFIYPKLSLQMALFPNQICHWDGSSNYFLNNSRLQCSFIFQFGLTILGSAIKPFG